MVAIILDIHVKVGERWGARAGRRSGEEGEGVGVRQRGEEGRKGEGEVMV